MTTSKSINYWMSVREHQMADGRKAWVWVVHHSQLKEPILYSKMYGDEAEAYRSAGIFSDDMGIEIKRPFKPRRAFQLIQGGSDEHEGEDIPKPS